MSRWSGAGLITAGIKCGSPASIGLSCATSRAWAGDTSAIGAAPPSRSLSLLEAPSEGAILAPHPFAPLSLLLHRLRTVLAVKGSLRRAQQRRALDGSGPF